MKLTPLFFLCFMLMSYNNYAQCPSSVSGQLSGSMTNILVTDSTTIPAYTVTPTGLPNTEFLIIQNDSIATDGFGPRILVSSMTGRISPNSFGLTTCNEVCVLPFSYDLSQLQLIVDSLLVADYAPGTTCCDAAGSFFIGLCDSLAVQGINSGADITNLNSVITLLSIFAGTSGGSTSVYSLTSTIDQLNSIVALFGNCAGNLQEICYSTIDSSFAKDCYTIVLPNSATSVDIFPDTVWMAPNSSTTITATYLPNVASDSIVWSIDGNGNTTVSSTGEVTAGNMAGTYHVFGQAIRGCASDSVVVIVDPALFILSSNSTQTTLQVLPNPFESTLQVQFHAKAGDYTVQLIGVTGQVHQNQHYTLSTGNQYLNLNTEAVPTGYYFLKITGAQTQVVQAVMKL